MAEDLLNEREFELVNIVGKELAQNQRDLSRHLNLSLGMTNMLLRRLVTKGYIRIRQLNKKKTQYILTPKGFTEKYRKSIKYTLNTINSIGLIRTQLNAIIERLYARGERVFYILGGSDLVVLVEMALSQPQWQGIQSIRIEQIADIREGVVFICQEKVEVPAHMAERCVNLIVELARHQDLAQRES